MALTRDLGGLTTKGSAIYYKPRVYTVFFEGETMASRAFSICHCLGNFLAFILAKRLS